MPVIKEREYNGGIFTGEFSRAPGKSGEVSSGLVTSFDDFGEMKAAPKKKINKNQKKGDKKN